MTREERIREAEDELAAIEPEYEEAKARYKEVEDRRQQAKWKLREAEESFDEGERVRVVETCDRGCCIERKYTGVVVGHRGYSHWDVQRDNGVTETYVRGEYLSRLEP